MSQNRDMGHPSFCAGILLGEVLRLAAEVGAEVEALDDHSEDVLEGEVGFLDVHGDVGRDDDDDVG